MKGEVENGGQTMTGKADRGRGELKVTERRGIELKTGRKEA